MAYTIFNTRNNEVTVVEDGTIDNTTDLKLIGKNYAGYGEIQNENFVFLLENFAGANQPPRPIAGQLWFDTTDQKIKLYDGNAENTFIPLANLHIGALPSGAAITAANVKKGHLWWDDVTGQLYAHTGASEGNPFVLVGPKASQDVLTDVIEDTVFDNLLVDGDPAPEEHEHKILKGFVNNKVIFIVSEDEFILDNSNSILGFDRIKKGITLVNTQNVNQGVTQDNFNFWGTASNAGQLGGVAAAEYVQRTNAVFTTEVSISDNDGLLIGPNDEAVLRVVGSEVELVSQTNGEPINFKVKNSGGTILTPLSVSATGAMPSTDNTFDIGSNSLRWNEVYAVNFRGIADNANNVLSDGTYRAASRLNTVNTIVTRDSVGDIYGTSFRGTQLLNSNDEAAAVTARVTRSDTVNVQGTSNYVNADVAATADKLALRDASGNINANQFNGLATRAATLRVQTNEGNFEHRSASVADLASAPNTIPVRDDSGQLFATTFVGSLNGNANTAGAWSTPRTLTVTGDASGSVSIDGSQNVTLSLTVGANRIALGTDTTGNYVQSIGTFNNDQYMNVYINSELDGAPRESAIVTLGVDADVAKTANSLVARGASNEINVGNISADDITVSDISASDITADSIVCDSFTGNLTGVDINSENIEADDITATRAMVTVNLTAEDIVSDDVTADLITANIRFNGNINQGGTSNNGWFNNLTVTNLIATNFDFGSNVTPLINGGTGATTAADARTNLDVYSQDQVDGLIATVNGDISNVSTSVIPLARGGTNATNAADARDNLGVYSQSAVDGLISNLQNNIDGISSDRITAGTSSIIVSNNSNITMRVANAVIGTVKSTGIELANGKKFIGTATQAEYADLAEKYTTEEKYPTGTVLAVCEHEDHEMALANVSDIVAGVVSEKPAFLMNAEAEGQAVALKGRVPVRVYGPVMKGCAVYVYQDGLASVDGEGELVGVALESNENRGENLVECFLKV